MFDYQKPLVSLDDEKYLPSKAHADDAGYDIKVKVTSICTGDELIDVLDTVWGHANSYIVVNGQTVDLNKAAHNPDFKTMFVGRKGRFILPDQHLIFPTGFRIQSPVCFMLVPRSGYGCKFGLTLSNSVGIIDPGYRGEVCVSLYNTGRWPIFIQDGERVAQGLFVPVLDFGVLEIVKTLNETERSDGKLGSTGS